MRKALIVGINDYPRGNQLNGCIPDANKMQSILSRHFDDSPNFACKKLISSETTITIGALKESIIELFDGQSDVALFYFSGHGSEPTNSAKACLVTQDGLQHNLGVEFDFLINTANKSQAREIVIILDCCFSGAAGNSVFVENITTLREGVSILTSSHYNQVSAEISSGGIFTSFVYDALDGGAGDTTGLITVAGVYAFADKLLGPWDQRPIFKSYVTKMMTLRKCKPQVELEVLRKLPNYFVDETYKFPLDPSFEPDAEPKNPENEAIFFELQQYNRASLLVPTEADHMYYAAMNSKGCELTPLGRYYLRLAIEGKL